MGGPKAHHCNPTPFYLIFFWNISGVFNQIMLCSALATVYCQKWLCLLPWFNPLSWNLISAPAWYIILFFIYNHIPDAYHCFQVFTVFSSATVANTVGKISSSESLSFSSSNAEFSSCDKDKLSTIIS